MQNAKEGMRITWIGLWVNLLLGAVKTLVGWLLGSKALIADGMHSLLDLLSDVVVLFGLSMARRPEDENHHFGHHKFVSLAKFFIGGGLAVFSISLVVSSVLDFRTGAQAVPFAGGAALVAIVSVLLKEVLFWWTRGVAKRLNSDLLMANAWHHRMDSISSVGVAVALLGVWLGGGDWVFLDGVVSLVLGCYLVFEAVKIFLRACADLLDTAPERAVIEDLREHILPTPGALAYHDFRVRRVGDVYEIDLHLQVDPQITVERGHQIAHDVKQRLIKQHPEVSKVLVHLEPANAEHIRQRGISDAEAPPQPKDR
ncbi:MAG: cation diffusion facilitator family transporter [Opitutae bacterium]|nr:cation diffusion facilitator family transporter [Opitutae bacterium]MDG2344776.1 cation diffusion facilitator family transporter [Opitutae bacterium]